MGAAWVESGEGRGGGVVGRGSARVDLVVRERGSKGIWRGRGSIARGKLTNGAPHLGAPLEIFFEIEMAHPAVVRHKKSFFR